MTYIYISKPWHHWFKWNLLARLVSSHYLVQCWIVNWTMRTSFTETWMKMHNLNSNELNEFRNVVCKIKAIFSWPQCVDDGDKSIPACPMVWCRDHFVYAPSQCIIVSHWLGAYTERSFHKTHLLIMGVEIKSTLVMIWWFILGSIFISYVIDPVIPYYSVNSRIVKLG